MTQFALEKGSSKAIKLDGKILGSVTCAEFKKINYAKKILQFLTDIPVAEVINSSYLITLRMNSGGEMPFLKSDKFSTLEVTDSGKTVCYLDCVVKSVEEVITPSRAVEYKVRLTAEARNEIDGN